MKTTRWLRSMLALNRNVAVLSGTVFLFAGAWFSWYPSCRFICRDGTMRRSWYDPLGWAGLDKVPRPDETLTRLQERRAEVNARRTELVAAISQKSRELSGLGVESEAMRGRPHLKKLHAAHQEKITALSNELTNCALS